MSSTLLYSSTRGEDLNQSFADATLGGLASDGGLFLPHSFPKITQNQWQELKKLSYPELAEYVISLFARDIPVDKIKTICQESYKNFSHPEIAPLRQLNDKISLLELYHGPTLAFKDYALQTLANIFSYLLDEKKQQLIIIGATSGDTGSAAIEACRDRSNITLFMLHPHNRTSEIQRLQMTTINEPNIHNIAINGNFDDCQRIVKHLLNNKKLLSIAGENNSLISAVNSINWSRILSQIVYYLFASLRVSSHSPLVNFVVPSGNFGNIFAGFVAKSIGAPINKLIIATNVNDILARTHKYGKAELKKVIPSLSPSMDIQVSSNFERLIYLLSNRDSELTKSIMQEQEHSKVLSLPTPIHQRLQKHFDASTINDEMTLKTIASYYDSHKLVLDPHSAIGVAVAGEFAQKLDSNEHIVSLATAHPSKFPSAIAKALGDNPCSSSKLDRLHKLKETFVVLEPENKKVLDHILSVVDSS